MASDRRLTCAFIEKLRWALGKAFKTIAVSENDATYESRLSRDAISLRLSNFTTPMDFRLISPSSWRASADLLSMLPDFEKLMEEQRERARKAQKKEEISVEEGEPGSRADEISWLRFSRDGIGCRNRFARQRTRRSEYCSRSDALLCRDGRPSWRSRIASRSGTRLDRSRSVARDRYAKARRRFCSSRDARGGSRARAGRGGAHLSGCRSAQIDSGTSHRHAFVALGIARNVSRAMRRKKEATSGRTN